jgi:hypothetical protein
MMLLKRVADLRHMTRPLAGEAPVHIDNRALDGFLGRFRESGCRDVDCGECRWCHEFVRKAVRIDEAHRAQVLKAYDELFRALHDGSMWKYLPGRDGAGGPLFPRLSLAGVGDEGDEEG